MNLDLTFDEGEQISFADSDWVLRPADISRTMYMVDAPGEVVRYFSDLFEALEELKELNERI